MLTDEREVLQRMAGGDKLLEKFDPFARYWRGEKEKSRIPDRTMENLLRRGLINQREESWVGWGYTITPAGREALGDG